MSNDEPNALPRLGKQTEKPQANFVSEIWIFYSFEENDSAFIGHLHSMNILIALINLIFYFCLHLKVIMKMRRWLSIFWMKSYSIHILPKGREGIYFSIYYLNWRLDVILQRKPLNVARYNVTIRFMWSIDKVSNHSLWKILVCS